MTMIQSEVIAGIDTHADTHHVAVIDLAGRRLGDAGFRATLIGYQAIAAYIAAFGLIRQVGIEGTHSYGAGVTVHLQHAGIRVIVVIRPNRQVRRMRGKSDPIDAYEAAKSVLAGHDHPEPKQLDGVVEALRYVHAARRSAAKARSATRVQIKSLLVTAPEQIRAKYRDHTVIKLIPALARTRPALDESLLVRTVLSSLKSLARRYQHLSAEVAVLDLELEQLVVTANPGLQQAKASAPSRPLSC